MQGHAFEDFPFGFIGEKHVVKHHIATLDGQRQRIGAVVNLGRLIQQFEHVAHVDQGLTDFTVDRAQKPQRQGDLDHIGVDHDKIAHGQRALLHADGRKHHDHDQPCGDNQGLAKVQEGQRIVGLDRGLFIFRHGHVIALRLPPFGTKIFNGFKVQQAVDRLLVGIRVLIVHFLADTDAHFGHGDGEPDIQRNRHQHGSQIPDIKQKEQNPGGQQQFQHQGHDGKQQESQQEIDALDAAFDNPAQAAGLAGDVIAHRQAMDMGKRLKRQTAQCALAHRRKHRVAQLGERHAEQTGHAISHGQPHSPCSQHEGRRGWHVAKTVHRPFIDQRCHH